MSAINLLPNLRKPWYNIGIIKMRQKNIKKPGYILTKQRY